MYYPAEMTAEEIEQFEYEINKLIDIERGEGQFWAANAELQLIAEEQAMDFENDYEPGYHDELERDWDEPYEPVTGCDPAEYVDCDSWYDEQYELDADYC